MVCELHSESAPMDGIRDDSAGSSAEQGALPRNKGERAAGIAAGAISQLTNAIRHLSFFSSSTVFSDGEKKGAKSVFRPFYEID